MYYDGFAMENLVAFHHDISSFLVSWLPQKVIYKTVKVITNNKATP